MKPIAHVSKRRADLESQYKSWPRHTLTTHFQKVCKKYKNRPYVHINDKSITYGEVWKDAETFARAMVQLGVKRRDHIAVLMENDLSYPSLYIATAMVGAVLVPINTMLQKDELAYILNQSEAQFLFIQQKIKKINYEHIVEALLEDKEFRAKSSLEKVVCIPREGKAVTKKFMPWNEFVLQAEKIDDDKLNERRNQSEYPEEVNTIMYTSGSTGKAKGVMLTHDNLLRSAYATCLSRAIEDGRVTYAPLPFYHCFNIIEGIMAMSFVGGALIAPSLYTPLSALQLMEKYKANDFLCVPSMFVPLLNQKNIDDFDLSHLFAVWCGAAPAPVTVWERAVKKLGLKEICTGYGQTEVTSSGVITEMGDPVEVITKRVGRPKLGGICGLPEYEGSVVQYRTIDTETGVYLEDGAVGELVVRGNTVTKGYYRKPDETAKTIDKDGWLRTGDVGRIDENGYIEHLGRSKEIFKVSGELVAPKEIESVINKHRAVLQANVIGVEDKITTETGAAFVELKEGETCTADEIRALCRKRLARFKVPRYVWFIKPTDWPLTATGKIQKLKLKGLADKLLGK